MAGSGARESKNLPRSICPIPHASTEADSGVGVGQINDRLAEPGPSIIVLVM